MHYWADMQSVHGLRCYDNIERTRNVSECCLYSLYAFYSFVFPGFAEPLDGATFRPMLHLRFLSLTRVKVARLCRMCDIGLSVGSQIHHYISCRATVARLSVQDGDRFKSVRRKATRRSANMPAVWEDDK